MQVFKSLAAFFEWLNTSYSAQYIFRKYWQDYYTLCSDVIVEKQSHVLISMIVVKIEM